MRAQWSRDDDPWPSDMRIQVDDVPHALLTVLFVRAAWNLAPDADVPDLDPAPTTGASTRPDTVSHALWTERWFVAWDRAWAWYEVATPAAVDGPAAGVPPAWQSTYGIGGLDLEALSRWQRALFMPLEAHLRKDQERRSLDALVPAWRAGIDSIVVLPYRGYYARRVGGRHLVVSGTTRDDPELYRRALRSTV